MKFVFWFRCCSCQLRPRSVGLRGLRDHSQSTTPVPHPQDMRSTAELWEAGMRCFNCGLQYDLLGQPYDPQLHDLDPYDPSLLGQPGLGAVVASVVRPGFLVSGCVVVKPLVRVSTATARDPPPSASAPLLLTELHAICSVSPHCLHGLPVTVQTPAGTPVRQQPHFIRWRAASAAPAPGRAPRQ